jgi:hypothetical protein
MVRADLVAAKLAEVADREAVFAAATDGLVDLAAFCGEVATWLRERVASSP